MFKNHIKVAWRSLKNNKFLFGVNTLGLALGIASCLLMALYVMDELSYDRFHEKVDQTVRVVFKAKINDEAIKEAVVMAPVAATLKSQFPEVVEATRIRDRGLQKIAAAPNKVQKSRFAYIDPSFFNVFSFPVRMGNTQNPLDKPYSVILTNTEAQKHFGNVTNALEKPIYIGDDPKPYTITAIIDDIPTNSHFHFDVFASMLGHLPAQASSWTDSGFHTYLTLKKDVDYRSVETKLPQVLEKHMGPQLQEALGVSYEAFTQKNEIGLFLQPLKDIHLYSDFTAASQMEAGGEIQYIYILLAVALFMVVIACVNFVNLSTATASRRAKEIGIKKVLGSGRASLRFQFLVESFLSTSVAFALAIGLVFLCLPKFNQLSGKLLNASILIQPGTLAILALLLLLVSLLAGGYPAILFASFKPIEALKSKFYRKRNTGKVRGSLVVFQFVISTLLIFATLIVKQQIDFIQNKKLGYDKDNILVLRDTYLLKENERAFMETLRKNPNVDNISWSAHAPAGPSDNDMAGVFVNNEFKRRVFVYNVDENYIPTLGMELLSGRNFSNTFGRDSTKVIINERMATALGFKGNPLGQSLAINSNQGKREYRVIGIVQDFHFKSLHDAIEPLLMVYNPRGGMVIRTKTAMVSPLIAQLQTEWKNLAADEPLQYSILDESYALTYASEQKIGFVLGLFSFLNILVACLGLFALVTFTTEQRLKEIGVRKVLGAKLLQLTQMLSSDFLKLVFLAFVFAFPLGYYVMREWLAGFAYRIDISWWSFILTGIISISIALVTISWQSVKAAMTNPAHILRQE